MAAEGFPPRLRVRKRRDFERAYAEGKKVVFGPLVLFARPNDRDAVRLGVTATRKLGNAVVRNRARRLVREAFRRVRSRLPSGYDCVVVARPPLLGLQPDEIQEILVRGMGEVTERDG